MIKKFDMTFSVPQGLTGESMFVPDDWDSWTEERKKAYITKYVQSYFVKWIQVTEYHES